MKTFLLFFTLVLISIPSISQETESRYSLKLYNLVSYEKFLTTVPIHDSTISHFRNSYSEFRFLHPTIAFEWRNASNNSHQIELVSLNFGTREYISEYVDSANLQQGVFHEGYSVVQTKVAVRYEYIINFAKASENKLKFTLGLGAILYFNKRNFHPMVASSFPLHETQFGLRTFVTPGLTYKVSPRVSVELNSPLSFSDFYIDRIKEENPALPIPERSSSSQNFQTFGPFFSARLGVGIRL